MKSFIYGHIHPYKQIKITLNFKFQAQASSSCTSHPHQFGGANVILIDLGCKN
jgi:hypothetical protein